MLKIDGKTFMNIQEAVQWLLDNNALPFQSTANYVANTEIGMGTIVNPSPAKVRIGSLIFFADSKVSTVTGLTENGFIVSDQYNNLVDDVAYVTNVAINASGHLITTMSDGQTIDAGLILQVTGFYIDASQHLIVSYNDGTTTDLGAIFSGSVTLTNLAVTGDARIFEQIVDANGHKRFQGGNLSIQDANLASLSPYAKWSLAGTHLMIVLAFNVAVGTVLGGYYSPLALVTLPAWIASKIVGMGGGSFLKYDANLPGYDSSYNELTKKIKYAITKPGGGNTIVIEWQESASYTWTEAGTYRIQFDLLIDND